MTGLSEKIANRHMVRHDRAEKAAFRLTLKAGLERMGYSPELEIHRGIRKNRNIVAGDPEKADWILTAHYDTPLRAPFPPVYTPFRPVLNFLLRLLPALGMLIICFITALFAGAAFLVLSRLFTVDSSPAPLAGTLGSLLGAVLPPVRWLLRNNRSNYNCNTSGLLTLVEIAAAVPKGEREKVLFVFTDNGEKWPVDFSGLAKKYQGLERKTVIDLDCIGSGDDIVVFTKNTGQEVGKGLARGAEENRPDGKRVLVRDQRRLRFCRLWRGWYGGGSAVVTALKRTETGLLYLDRIGCRKDVICDKRNIAAVKELVLALIGGASGVERM